MDAGTGHNAERRARQLWLVPSEGEHGRQLIADVAVNAPATDLYAYAVPDGLKDVIQPGAALRVAYGRGGRAVEGGAPVIEGGDLVARILELTLKEPLRGDIVLHDDDPASCGLGHRARPTSERDQRPPETTAARSGVRSA